MSDTTATDLLEELATLFADAWTARTVIDSLPPILLTDRQSAYLVQDLMARRIGQQVAGWKAGATSDGMRARDGHDGVVPGRVFMADLHLGDDLRLKAGRFPNGRLEPEFAFRFLRGTGLRSNWTAEELAPIVAPHIAIEIIGSRMSASLPASCRNTAMTIADNGNGFALVIGPEIPSGTAYDPLSHPVDMRIDDSAPAANSPPDIRAEPLEALADTVNLLADRGLALEAGQYITTGSATATLPVVAGSTVSADFGALGRIRINFT